MSESLESIHDKCKQVILFHNNLSKFFKALKGVLPESAPILKLAIANYKSMPRVTYIEALKSLMEPHMKYVSQYDEGVFTDDYKKGELTLIPCMDFRKVWDLINAPSFDDTIRSGTKKSVFNHLQTIYISANMALDQIGAFNKNMEKQKALLMNMIENLKLGDEVKKRMEELKTEEEQKAAKDSKGGLFGSVPGLSGLLKGDGLSGLMGGEGLGDLKDLFGDDNFVFQLAKDIVDELDMGSEEIDGPMSSIMNLFANNGSKIQELIVKVGDKLEQKLATGEIDRSKLMKDAQKMKDKLATVAPGLSDMIGENGFNAPFKAHYDSMSAEDKELFVDVLDILNKPFGDRTEEDHARCMSMPGFEILRK
jgi:hypothetical protein